MNRYLQTNKYMDEWFRKHEEGSCVDCKHLDISRPWPNRCKLSGKPFYDYFGACVMCEEEKPDEK